VVCQVPVTIAISDPSVTEGNAGTVNAAFSVTLSAPSSQTVTVQYKTAPGTAKAGTDYTSKPLTTLSFASGETAKTVNIAVKGDLLDEDDETFFVNLSNAIGATIADAQGVATILDNDPLPALSIQDVAVAESDAAGVSLGFVVTLSPASGRSVTLSHATQNGSAVSGSDYTAKSGTLTFGAGQTSKTLAVPVTGEDNQELDETLFLNLSLPVNATIGDTQGQGTIQNDDGPPSMTIADKAIVEGNTGMKNLNFTVTLSGTTYNTVTVNYATADARHRALVRHGRNRLRGEDRKPDLQPRPEEQDAQRRHQGGYAPRERRDPPRRADGRDERGPGRRPGGRDDHGQRSLVAAANARELDVVACSRNN